MNMDDSKLGRTQPTDVHFEDATPQKAFLGEDTDMMDEVDEKKVLRKMDLHILPIVTVLYLLCFLDRGNIGNAKIEGLLDDLHMSGPEYNWCRKFSRAASSSFEARLASSGFKPDHC